MGELGDWGKKNSKYITIPDGETIEGKFEGSSFVPSNFNPENTVVAYQIEGKIFNSGSRKLATAMDAVPIGSIVRISRTGAQAKTKYHVEVTG